jgi:hypothetical protein
MLLSFPFLYSFFSPLVAPSSTCARGALARRRKEEGGGALWPEQLGGAGEKEAVAQRRRRGRRRGEEGGIAGEKDRAAARSVLRRHAQSLAQPHTPLHP